jgi:hypothetical protein
MLGKTASITHSYEIIDDITGESCSGTLPAPDQG